MQGPTEPRVVCGTRDRVGECPVWSVAEQALYWVDIEGRHIHRYDWKGQSQRTWNTAERVGCIALTDVHSPQAVLLAAMETGIFRVVLGPSTDVVATLVAPVLHPRANMRFNDGRCDRQGRLWVSTMCMDMAQAAQVGGVYCLDETGLGSPKMDGLITPNGMAFSPDDQTFYVSDSHSTVQKIWAFDLELATADVSGGREFVDMMPLPGRPDGAAMDAQGCYWICANDAGQIHRFSPSGQHLSSMPVPVSKPSMCAFGGPGLDVLFVTSIQPAAATGNDAALSGAVFALDAGVRGLPEPVFTRWPSDSVRHI